MWHVDASKARGRLESFLFVASLKDDHVLSRGPKSYKISMFVSKKTTNKMPNILLIVLMLQRENE